MDELEIKLLELRVQNLIALRQSIMSALVVLVGGTIGVSITVPEPYKWFLVFAGVFYIFVLSASLRRTEVDLKKHLNKGIDYARNN